MSNSEQLRLCELEQVTLKSLLQEDNHQKIGCKDGTRACFGEIVSGSA